jgi:diaminobutyrate-2-oxoglutarate transaminase
MLKVKLTDTNLNSGVRPIIKTSLPGIEATRLLELQQQLESSGVSYPRLFPLVPSRAEGEWIEDVDGNIFLDFTSMAGVATLGHSPQFLNEFIDAAGKIMTTLDYPTVARVNFLEVLHNLLNQKFGEEMKIHLTAPTGENAVEAALKLCRLMTGSSTIISFTGSYHGMSAGAAAISDLPKSPRLAPALTTPSRFVPFPNCCRFPVGLERTKCNLSCLDYVEKAINEIDKEGERFAGAIIEPVQGEGGTVPAPVEYLKELQHLINRRGGLLIVDEVQTGFGRTGYTFAWERVGVAPDILVFSKGVSGVGAPMAGIAFKESLNGWPSGSHIGTFRGFVPAFASAVRALTFLEQTPVLEYVRRNGQEMETFLKQNLAELSNCGEVRAAGYMFGIEIVRDTISKEPDANAARAIAQELFSQGIIVEIGGAYQNVVRMLPPLITEPGTLRYGMEAIVSVIRARAGS